MKHRLPQTFIAGALVGLVAVVGPLGPARGSLAQSSQSVANAGHACLIFTGSGDVAFVQNFNPYASGSFRDLTLGGVYEPLFAYTTAGGGHLYPWLATKWAWSKDNLTLTISLRASVKWSDGQPFGADDVIWNFNAGKIDKSLDKIGLTNTPTNIAGIAKVDDLTVAVTLKKPDSTWTDNIAGYNFIVPAHIWSTVKDPVHFTNPTPVGTGPFTTLQKFTSQSYTFAKNPNYWQAGKPYVPCVTRVASASNDAATLALINGDVDWAGVFVPDPQKEYASKDPAHFHYFYPAESMPTDMVFNDQQYPFSLTGFRQAVSMALDRKTIVTVGEFGTSNPAGAIGFEAVYPKWVNASVEASAKKFVSYDPAGAKALLLKLGFKYDNNGALLDPKGKAVSIPLVVPAGWSDYVLSLQIVQRDLQAIGIPSSLKLDPDYGSFQKSAYTGAAVYFNYTCAGGQTPIYYFASNLSKDNFVPSGNFLDTQTKCNFPHYYDPAAKALIDQFHQQTDTGKQLAIMAQLEALMVKDFPIVPVMVQPTAFLYSTKYFTGFPTAANDYAKGPYWAFPDIGVVLTRVKPVM